MDRSTFLTQLHRRFELPLSSVQDMVERISGQPIAEVHRVVRGDENEVYRVTLVNRSVVYVRAGFPDSPPHKLSREAEMMQRARAEGVPAPNVWTVESLATEQGDRQTMVLAEAAGTQLSQVLPRLSVAERTTVMQNVGRLLGLLGNVGLPGHGKPDEHSHWPDPHRDRRRYLAAVRTDSQLLDGAGFTTYEVQQIGAILDRLADVPIDDPAILCHCDISPEHLFIGADQAVTGLIDWGMWCGGTTADELAVLSTRLRDDDFSTVFAHHPTAAPSDHELRRDMATSILTRGIGELAWLVRSSQSDRRQTLASATRQAVRQLQALT